MRRWGAHGEVHGGSHGHLHLGRPSLGAPGVTLGPPSCTVEGLLDGAVEDPLEALRATLPPQMHVWPQLDTHEHRLQGPAPGPRLLHSRAQHLLEGDWRGGCRGPRGRLGPSASGGL